MSEDIRDRITALMHKHMASEASPLDVPNLLILGHDERFELERVIQWYGTQPIDLSKPLMLREYKGMKIVPACEKNCLIVAKGPK